MARTLLDEQLYQIRAKINHLGKLVETALGEVLQAISSDNPQLCEQIVASDQTIDGVRSEVDHLAFQALMLQQPLGGSDLRFLSSCPLILSNLERAGDNATGAAKVLLQLSPLRAGAVILPIQPSRSAEPVGEASIITGLVELGEEARRMLQGTMRAFEQNDAQAARKIWQEDDLVDVRYHLVRHDLITMLSDAYAIPALQQDPRSMRRTSYWLWIAHDLERLGDHCTNICERIVYFLEGEKTISPSEDS
jgi:phosphate transport system protein